jgi:hypothetical protein
VARPSRLVARRLQANKKKGGPKAAQFAA